MRASTCEETALYYVNFSPTPSAAAPKSSKIRTAASGRRRTDLQKSFRFIQVSPFSKSQLDVAVRREPPKQGQTRPGCRRGGL